MKDELKTLTVYLDDGGTVEWDILGRYHLGENSFIALLPPNHNAYLIYRYEWFNDKITLFNIENEYLYNTVLNAFNKNFNSIANVQGNYYTNVQQHQDSNNNNKGCGIAIVICIIIFSIIVISAIVSDKREKAEQEALQQVRQAQQEAFGIWSIRNRVNSRGENIRFVNAFINGHNRTTNEVFMTHFEYHRNPDQFLIYLVEITGIFGRRNINVGNGNVSITVNSSGRDPVSVSGFAGDGHNILISNDNATRLLRVMRAEGNITITIRGSTRTYTTDTFNASGFNNINREF